MRLNHLELNLTEREKHLILCVAVLATVQNKVHYAIHGKTAAEVIISRADRTLPNMGLTNWEGDRAGL